MTDWNEYQRATIKAAPDDFSDSKLAEFYNMSIVDVRAIRNEPSTPRTPKYDEGEMIGMASNGEWRRMMTEGSFSFLRKLNQKTTWAGKVAR